MSDQTQNRIFVGIVVFLVVIVSYLLGIGAAINHYESLACEQLGYDVAIVEIGSYLEYAATVTCSKTTIEEMELK